ncbi:LuxR C-terminal-related transcriptional regulator [Phyllobacterium myrsinacearum]|uniref:LuxR C-terminal-related transcriptional regulator n=1 Tax=Phyllobacterium myrsinacearum TaxID=28101 RepID=UPI0015FA8BFF|nr:LuxR C-terminal-related transcriptional regulator [Phyllobacterium myrsinacearum]
MRRTCKTILLADRLILSDHTVKVHVHNLIRKLKVHNRTQAAAIYRNYLEGVVTFYSA